MKLLIIRHGDPDYSIDNLTEVGRKEAAALAEYLKNQDVTSVYVSPLGRAQATCDYYLQKTGKTAETLPWMREFYAQVRLSEDEKLAAAIPVSPYLAVKDSTTPWDVLPDYLAADENYYHKEDWRKTTVAQHSDTEEIYQIVANGLDALLKKHGYARQGNIYRAEHGNHDTLALFCHFGVECVMLSHLLGISPFPLWHGFVAAPSSVTTVYTEERRKGVVSWRVGAFGDTSHLALAGLFLSFHARFCECFEDDTRH